MIWHKLYYMILDRMERLLLKQNIMKQKHLIVYGIYYIT